MELIFLIVCFMLGASIIIILGEGLGKLAIVVATIFAASLVTFITLINIEHKFVSEETVITTKYTENMDIKSELPMTILIKKYKPFKLSFRTRYLYIIDGITITINK